MPDLFFHRDPEEVEKEEREKAEAAAESQMVKAPDFVAPDKEDWGADAAVTDWAADGQPAAAPVAPQQLLLLQEQQLLLLLTRLQKTGLPRQRQVTGLLPLLILLNHNKEIPGEDLLSGDHPQE